MLYYAVKVLVSAVIIVAVSELGKRNTMFAALLASLPLTSLLAFLWLRWEGSSEMEIARLSLQIFWLVLPSLVLFVVLAWLLGRGVRFGPGLAVSVLATAGAYALLLPLLKRWGVAA